MTDAPAATPAAPASIPPSGQGEPALERVETSLHGHRMNFTIAGTAKPATPSSIR